MLPGLEMMSCPNLAVPTEVMQNVVHIESDHNPFAIGVVGGQLVRQPQNMGEALATVRMLDAQGYNFSVGIAQVNRANLSKYGLDTYEKAFDACANLAAGARILSECYASSGDDWGKAFSCYYSGNFVTGYRDGYVQKVYDSIGRSLMLAGHQAATISVATTPTSATFETNTSIGRNAYRIALRSSALDTAANAVVAPIVTRMANIPAHHSQTDDVSHSAKPVPTGAGSDDIFVPQVRGPDDPVAAPPQTAPSAATASPADPADLRQGDRDDAFVF